MTFNLSIETISTRLDQLSAERLLSPQEAENALTTLTTISSDFSAIIEQAAIHPSSMLQIQRIVAKLQQVSNEVNQKTTLGIALEKIRNLSV